MSCLIAHQRWDNATSRQFRFSGRSGLLRQLLPPLVGSSGEWEGSAGNLDFRSGGKGSVGGNLD